MQGVGQPGDAVAPQAQQPLGDGRRRQVAGQRADELGGGGEGQDRVLARGRSAQAAATVAAAASRAPVIEPDRSTTTANAVRGPPCASWSGRLG